MVAEFAGAACCKRAKLPGGWGRSLNFTPSFHPKILNHWLEASEELAALSAHLMKVEEEVWCVAFCPDPPDPIDLTFQSFSSWQESTIHDLENSFPSKSLSKFLGKGAVTA